MDKQASTNNLNRPSWGGQKWISLKDLSSYRGALM